MALTRQKQIDDIALIYFTESTAIDAINNLELKHELLSTLERNRCILLDMSNINFMDSSALGMFISVLRTSHKFNKQFILFNLNRPIIALFELLRLHKIFNIHTTEAEAIKNVN